MKDKYTNIIRKIFGILLSLSIISAGLCLIYGCLCIYYSGEHPYSHQAVADAFSKIAVPVYICLALTVVSLVSGLFIKDNNKPLKPSPSVKLKLISSKKDFTSCTENELSAIKKEIKKRKKVKTASFALISLFSLLFLIYAVNPNNFDSTQINNSMIKASYILGACLGGMFLSAIVAEILIGSSIKREISLLSSLPTKKSEQLSELEKENRKDRKIIFIRCLVIILSLGFIACGFAFGGFYDVLTKAINICTECIGLG